MTNKTLKRCAALTTVIGAVCAATGASAFDSAGADLTLATPLVPAANPAEYPMRIGWNSLVVPPTKFDDPFGLVECHDAVSLGGCWSVFAKRRNAAQYFVSMVHQATGIGSNDDSDVAHVYSCPMQSSGQLIKDLSACAPLPYDAEAEVTIGWLRTRKAWTSVAKGAWQNTGHGPEHLQVLLAAAQYAGLATSPLMTQRFWVRYPVRDQYVATELPTAPGTFATAQTWIPRGFASTDDVQSHATRSVFLPELAQLPDVSSALWDWAAGNEASPANGASPFGDTAKDTNAWHDFRRMLGAENESHFLPAGRQFWSYNHALAKARMLACASIADKLSDYYAQSGSEFYGSFSTEGHECEREALAFEMIAQHFLQDAWSTGHMWRRWGSPDVDTFPAQLGISPYKRGLADTSPDAYNLPARRFMLAGLVGAFAGTIHGAKGVSADLLKPGTWPGLDDPLSGPFFYNGTLGQRQRVSWVTSNADEVAPGVGDMFWVASGAAHLATDPELAAQRQRLLACSASSLREVYGLGRQLHGQMDPPSVVPGGGPDDPGVVVDGLDPSSSFCWDHWATNASMYGSIGPLAIDYEPNPVMAVSNSAYLLTLVNEILINERAKQAVFPNEADRVTFMRVLRDRMTRDSDALRVALLGNAKGRHADANGTDSARMLRGKRSTGEPDAAREMSFLATAPGADRPAGPPAPYSDVDPSSGAATPRGDDGYVSKMFWRSHLADSCQDSTPLYAFRQRCLNAAPNGGDPESCTACVELADAFMPTCYPGKGLVSKCSLLGGTAATAIPAEWLDRAGREARPSSDPLACGYPSYFSAIAYCTDTTGGLSNDGALQRTISATTPTPSAACPDLTEWDVVRRVGIVHKEQGGIGVPLLVTARQETISYRSRPVPGSTCEAFAQTTGDDIVANVVAPFPMWSDESSALRALVNANLQSDQQGGVINLTYADSLKLEFCGTTQRLTLWNRSCADLRDPNSGVYSPVIPANAPDASRGSTAFSFSYPVPGGTEDRCPVREPRVLRPTCTKGICGSAGTCIPSKDPARGAGASVIVLQ